MLSRFTKALQTTIGAHQVVAGVGLVDNSSARILLQDTYTGVVTYLVTSFYKGVHVQSVGTLSPALSFGDQMLVARP